ncbi:transient receptor potential cation channel subfamily V member 5-like [Bolinopsis microptera]|uniref:transient receptor potential cation channel subfamily V member 5-like n=1 Tax=Bolinopsis microptera TaxID=2820187 RepID=UPI003079D30D
MADFFAEKPLFMEKQNDNPLVMQDPNAAPRKLKYLWLFVTSPSRMYRRFEWWCISKFLATKDVKRERITFKLHEKYRENPQLALLYYFHDLAKTTKTEDTVTADLYVIKKLLKNGADPHACDDGGQNMMHEIARYHRAEICYFFLEYKININLENDYCVTPLHVAAAFNNSAVVEILANNGGILESTTFYMLQTPLHYAARYDSPNSVKTLVKMGAKIEARDYRGRTPLLLAAELGRVQAGAMLLECGAKVYAIDFTGMYGISAMVDKCPPLAIKALETCVERDLRSRKEYYSLQFLEPTTLCNDNCAKTTFTVLEETVRAGSGNLDIVKHSMIQKMIEVKWLQFGRRGYIKELAAYIIVLINWSLLCLFNPIRLPEDMKNKVIDPGIQRVEIANEILTVLFFFYQVFDESREMRTNMRRHSQFVLQRMKQLEMEFKYLELLSDEEKEYLHNEQISVKHSKSVYTNDAWNTFDWFSIALMFVTMVVHFTIKYGFPDYFVQRGILLSITLVIVWLKMFKYCRVLKTLGPFCVIIASLPKDFMKIALVYIILYVPMVCTFFHFFCEPYADELKLEDDFDETQYGSLPQTFFTVFVYTLVGDYGYETLKLITAQRKQYFAFTQIIIAYWILVSAVLLLNIFIALMSDTFARVYENAQVVSQFERAAMIVSIENKLPSYWRKHHLIDISYNYAPVCSYFDDDSVPESEASFEEELKESSDTLKSLVTKAQGKKESDIIKFVKQKIQTQNELIGAILEKIESKTEGQTLVK